MKREAQRLGEAPGVTAGESLDRLQSFLERLEAIEKAFQKQQVSAQAAERKKVNIKAEGDCPRLL